MMSFRLSQSSFQDFATALAVLKEKEVSHG